MIGREPGGSAGGEGKAAWTGGKAAWTEANIPTGALGTSSGTGANIPTGALGTSSGTSPRLRQEKCPRAATVVEVRRLSPDTEVDRPLHCPVCDRWAIFREGAAGHGCSAHPCPRPAKTRQTAHASRAGRRGVRLTLLGGANLTHLGPRGARCAFCPAAARLARSAPRIPGKGVPGHICSVGGSGHPRATHGLDRLGRLPNHS